MITCRYLKYTPLSNKKWNECRRRSLKGTLSVTSRDPPGKDKNVRLTTVPLKALSDYV